MARKRKSELDSQKTGESDDASQAQGKKTKVENGITDSESDLQSADCKTKICNAEKKSDVCMESASASSSSSASTSSRSGQKAPKDLDKLVILPGPDIIKQSKVKMMPSCPKKAVNIAVASRALFTLDEEHEVYENKGLQEYLDFQIKREGKALDTGTAFPFVLALEHVNSCLRSLDEKEEHIFNIVLMSHNHAHTGVRLLRSVQEHKLNIQRMCLTGGSNPVDYLEAYNISLYLTSYPEEVEQALERGFAAAAMLNQKIVDPVKDQLRIAFDLDAVLLAADSDKIFQSQGFAAYIEHEQELKDKPIREGPLKQFASAIGRMQQRFREHPDTFPVSPIRTYIVTARSACVGERALKTLRSWGLEVDELHFLSGASKGPILAAIKPHIFFDDADHNIVDAEAVGTPAAHVRHGQYTKPIFSDGQKDRVVRKMSFYNNNNNNETDK